MRKVIEQCPTCESELLVTRMSCTSCETVIQGRYATCKFCRLSPESLGFLEIFIRNRGNLKDMERELGLPYSAIRGRVNEVISELGFEAPAGEDDDAPARRKEVLDRLDRGEIKAAEAAEMLAQLKS